LFWEVGGQVGRHSLFLLLLLPFVFSDQFRLFILFFGLSHDQVAFGAPERLEDTKTRCLEEALTLVGF